jgi:steroid delta-isomerase-like uncharacterized protein
MTPTDALRSAREATVREHMESENRHDFDTTISTFDHPRYELIATGDVHDGEAEVRAYFDETRTAFPDQTNEPLEFHHSDRAVVVEFLLRGTHRGPLRGLPATGRSFECRMCALFLFEEGGEKIVGERVYFDQATILRQLGVAHDPQSVAGRVTTALSHPVTVGRALLGGLRGR